MKASSRPALVFPAFPLVTGPDASANSQKRSDGRVEYEREGGGMLLCMPGFSRCLTRVLVFGRQRTKAVTVSSKP